MSEAELHVVTGAFSYSGKYITRRLLARGHRVKTLTGHPNRPNPFGDQVSVAPFSFDQPQRLVESLRGAAVLYNTYWVRFGHGQVTYDQAVANTRTLFAAAKTAGVGRVVHVSITNPSPTSPLPYFRGKGELEADLAASGLPHAIVRPTVIFGSEDILINNIAWVLRRSPVFGLPGDGEYRLQPIFVEDFADLVVAAGEQQANLTSDPVGPETFTFRELVALIARTVGRRSRLIRMRPGLAWAIARTIGLFLGDVMLTRDEVAGLMANLLVSQQAPTGQTRLSEWLRANAATVGAEYHSELKRHF